MRAFYDVSLPQTGRFFMSAMALHSAATISLRRCLFLRPFLTWVNMVIVFPSICHQIFFKLVFLLGSWYDHVFPTNVSVYGFYVMLLLLQ
jgi:hypothetical protein